MEHITSKHIILPYPTAIAVGKFDALHVGHAALIRALIDKAKENSLKTVIFSFYPAPFETFCADGFYTFIGAEKLEIISDLFGSDIDYFIEYPFNADFAAMSPNDFLCDFLTTSLKCKLLAVGDDYRFGNRRQGDVALIKETSKRMGFEVLNVNNVTANGSAVSSERIRSALSNCELSEAKNLMGRDFFMHGTAKNIRGPLPVPLSESGAAPCLIPEITAFSLNVPSRKLCPATGSYICSCRFADKSVLQSVTHINSGASPYSVEVHIPYRRNLTENAPVNLRFISRASMSREPSPRALPRAPFAPRQ